MPATRTGPKSVEKYKNFSKSKKYKAIRQSDDLVKEMMEVMSENYTNPEILVPLNSRIETL